MEKKQLNELPELVSPVGTDLLHVKRGAGTDYKSTLSNLNLGGAVLVKRDSAYNGELVYGYNTNTISFNDTAPTSNEGTSLLTLPYSATGIGNILKIIFFANISPGGSPAVGGHMCLVLFIDSTSNALKTTFELNNNVVGQFKMLSGFADYTTTTTDSVTFRIKGGSTAGAGITNNGVGTTVRLFGGTACTGIIIEEYQP